MTDVVRESNARRAMYEIMNEWIEQGIVDDVVNEKYKLIIRYKD